MRPLGQAVLRSRRARVRPVVLMLIAVSTLMAALILIFRFSVEDATLGDTVESALVVSGLMSASFIWVRSKSTRQVADYLLLGAVLTLTLAQFAFFAAPALMHEHSSAHDAPVPLFAHLEVAVMFAGAALTRRSLIATRRQAMLLLATPVAVGAVSGYRCTLALRGLNLVRSGARRLDANGAGTSAHRAGRRHCVGGCRRIRPLCSRATE